MPPPLPTLDRCLLTTLIFIALGRIDGSIDNSCKDL